MSCTRWGVVRSRLGGSFEPAAAEVGEIPLAQHVLAVQLEAALAQTKMVGQLPGRAADREVLQNQRLGLAHAFDLPRGAAGRVGLVGQAQQLIQQPHGGIAQLAGSGVGGVVQTSSTMAVMASLIGQQWTPPRQK